MWDKKVPNQPVVRSVHGPDCSQFRQTKNTELKRKRWLRICCNTETSGDISDCVAEFESHRREESSDKEIPWGDWPNKYWLDGKEDIEPRCFDRKKYRPTTKQADPASSMGITPRKKMKNVLPPCCSLFSRAFHSRYLFFWYHDWSYHYSINSKFWISC